MESNQSSNHQLTRQERRELRRQEMKGATPSQKQKGKRIMFWIITLVVIAAVAYGLILASRKASLSEANRPGQAFAIQGQEHIAAGADHVGYNSNPPTSGPHYAAPANWEVYQNELPDEQLVHNLEHGGIWISYKGINATTTTALENIAKSQTKIIVTPRSKNDAPIILASWGRLQKLETFDEKAILDFIRMNKGRSPEPLAP